MHSRTIRRMAVVGLTAAIASGCGMVDLGNGDALRQRAQAVLAAWDTAQTGSQAAGLVIAEGMSTLMVGPDWGSAIDGGNAKMAMMAGLFAAETPLSADTPPPGQVRWKDGTTQTLPVRSAAEAFEAMKADAEAIGSCKTCTPLTVTGATLVTATFRTSRGEADAPAWEFSLKDTPVRMDRVAVLVAPAAPAAIAVDIPSGAFRIDRATIDTSNLQLTVTFTGAPDSGDRPCGADYDAEAVESSVAIVVVVHAHEHVSLLPVACSAVGAWRTATAGLAKPLGTRVLLDIISAEPIQVTSAS
jgi:hypothetical protein